MAAVLALAFIRGDARVRAAALAYAFAWVGSILLQDITQLSGIQTGVLLVDVILLLALTGLCWGAKHPWIYFASGAQLVGVLSHVFAAIDDRIGVGAYYSAFQLCTYLVVGMIAWGALRSPD
ncbi:hypothetical protein Q0812_09460 [Brevundimonas sp. 2R-24]|uniref:Lysoplasmalogenase n=1 Tax=Peiella sedimenti TaxID=3061083 RepID=A0ABT8SP93_9CAUL|nr:hypothetical protein [Caulobacteraceae bacterium XZ-24]